MKNQLGIPAVENHIKRYAFRPPSFDDFAHCCVQAYDQSLANTGVALINVNGNGIHLLATSMIRPPADVLEIKSTEGNYARADHIYDGIRRHRTGYARSANAVVYERPPVKGMRTESILLAGREVHRATDGEAVMVDNRHAKKLIVGRAGNSKNPVTKAHVKEAVERYITPPEASGKLMPWNEHVRDACLLALAWLLDEKQRQVAEVAQAEPLFAAA